jgi:hypothetical protein
MTRIVALVCLAMLGWGCTPAVCECENGRVKRFVAGPIPNPAVVASDARACHAACTTAEEPHVHP